MAAYDVDAFDSTNAFDTDAWDFTALGYFQGSVPSDGGRMWPPRANDPRWAQVLTDSGISQSGNFIDDVKTALDTITGKQKLDLNTQWRQFLEANGKTDPSEPFTY